MEKMLKMMEMVKMMESMNTQNEEYINNDEQTNLRWRRLNDFDNKIQTEFLRSVKVAIPFLDIPYQKDLSVMIKLLEIQKLSNYYDEKAKLGDIQFTETQNSQAQSVQTKSRQAEMLRAMRDEMSGETRQKMDTMIKIIEATEMMAKIKEMRD